MKKYILIFQNTNFSKSNNFNIKLNNIINNMKS